MAPRVVEEFIIIDNHQSGNIIRLKCVQDLDSQLEGFRENMDSKSWPKKETMQQSPLLLKIKEKL